MSYLKYLTLALTLLILPLASEAQTGRRGERLSQLENAKIAYLTDKLALTQDQAQRFWPVYNEYSDKRRDLNRRQRQLRTDNPDALTDQQLRDNIRQVLALRQQEVDLEKDYVERFQKVISLRQTARLFIAERQFTKEVLQRVADRRGGRPGPPPGGLDE
ncbi:hypothetical protein FY528_01420 [Hymenobacter lutimineralis]|uniref:Periplasmic heavy metal sensor n=1 Tax=Hymenobacter lutimineralis TaxID=2606448 RepID=A0A5D6VGL1_9BACT|nr:MULTISPECIES: hypothetical protein [Hymenobacter]QIX60161.1 hypothetical protein HER32_02745 [Hymenobacter sp. BT18]TYZ14417.1 hypothetical protein FY528_01420 [Hymenobacter lutimineralis]